MEYDDQMRLDRATFRASVAKTFLDNDAAIDALEALEQKYVSQFRNSAPEDQSKREDAYRMLRTLNEFRDQISAFAKSGVITAHNLRSRLRS
jgi:hypothetical protein